MDLAGTVSSDFYSSIGSSLSAGLVIAMGIVFLFNSLPNEMLWPAFSFSGPLVALFCLAIFFAGFADPDRCFLCNILNKFFKFEF